MSKTIIVAVDETQLENFKNVVDSLDSDLCMIKVGSVSFNALGHQAISFASNKGFKIFLDLKLHDIPNTVKIYKGISFSSYRYDDHTYLWWIRNDESCKESC